MNREIIEHLTNRAQKLAENRAVWLRISEAESISLQEAKQLAKERLADYRPYYRNVDEQDSYICPDCRIKTPVACGMNGDTLRCVHCYHHHMR